MVEFLEVSPVLTVADVPRAMQHYRTLGFEVSRYTEPGGSDGGYAYAHRGPLWLHLSLVPHIDPRTSVVSVYLYVSDADALYDEWSRSGAAGRFHRPADTDYGLREGAHVDPDGNLVRFGSWLPGHGPTG